MRKINPPRKKRLIISKVILQTFLPGNVSGGDKREKISICRRKWFIPNYDLRINENEFTFSYIDGFEYYFRDFYQDKELKDEFYEYQKKKIVIDLSKVEVIDFLHIDVEQPLDSKYEGYQVFLFFKSTSGFTFKKFEKACGKNKDFTDCELPVISENIQKVLIPIGFITVNKGENYQSSEHEKIAKAFNHLRKLCGAPEPISFD